MTEEKCHFFENKYGSHSKSIEKLFFQIRTHKLLNDSFSRYVLSKMINLLKEWMKLLSLLQSKKSVKCRSFFNLFVFFLSSVTAILAERKGT